MKGGGASRLPITCRAKIWPRVLSFFSGRTFPASPKLWVALLINEYFQHCSSFCRRKRNYGKILRVFPQPLSNNGISVVRRVQQQKWEGMPQTVMPPSRLLFLVDYLVAPLEVLLVEDELDIGLGVRQTLFLQGFPQLRGTAEKHPHFRPVGKKRTILDNHRGLESRAALLEEPADHRTSTRHTEIGGKRPHPGCFDAILVNSLSQFGFP